MVTHPNPSVGAITFGSAKYDVDDDGVIDCPGDVEADMADHLAEHYGVDRDTIAGGEKEAEELPKPEDLTVDEAEIDEPEEDPLEEKTVAELRDLAAEAEVEGRSSMTKDELIDALED